VKIAYGDLIGGISGDMFVAAMLDLGLPLSKLKSELKKIPTLRYTLTVSKKTVHSIRATHFQVVSPDKESERSWKQIRRLIAGSGLLARVKETGIDIFSRLAEAEGKIHGVAPEKVHFHEIGATDSIVDIMAAAIGVHELGIDACHFSRIPLGRGLTHALHGPLPIPGPATLELLKGIPVQGIDLDSETVTPTGAAIVHTLGKGFGAQPSMTIEKVGYGAGQKDFPNRPNLFRLVIGTDSIPWSQEEMLVIETNIDRRRRSRRVPVADSNEKESPGNIAPRDCRAEGSGRAGANYSQRNLDYRRPLLPCQSDHPQAHLGKA
jgi:pyridinium-3,5-bisthiocarboxylic acid mononucleotide nickel chelatase